jgi:hypothetical protein
MTIITGAMENRVKNARDPALAKALLSSQKFSAWRSTPTQCFRNFVRTPNIRVV